MRNIKKEPVRLLELFGGIGACSAAFERLGVPYEIVDYVEIDKYAVKSYNAIHGTNFEPQDITQWDKEIDVDFIMHGSPCQDFSIAGQQAGGDKGSGTRSSLMYETVRIVEKLKPTYVLWENVANMMSDKHRHNFDAYWDAMEKMGYHNASYRLNAKDYGIPQNRVRIFTLSVLCPYWEEDYFIPPKNFQLNKCLADILDQNVDEKYYLSDKALDGLIKHKQKHQEKGNGFGCRIIDLLESNPPVIPKYDTQRKNDISILSPTISARYYKDGSDCLIREPKVKQIGNLFQYKRENPSAGRVYDQSGLCPTLTNMQGGHRQPYIVQESQSLCPQGGGSPFIAAMRGRYLEKDGCLTAKKNTEINHTKIVQQHLEINSKGLCNTLTSVQKDNLVFEPFTTTGHRIFGCIRSTIYKQGTRNLIESVLNQKGYEGVVETIGLPIVNATKVGYDLAFHGDSVNLNYPESTTRRGRVGHGCAQTLTCSDSMGVVLGETRPIEPSLKYLGGIGTRDWAGDGKKLSRNFPQGQRIYDAKGLACSQTAQGGGLGSYTGLYYVQYRIRKLTPKECWRLMGFTDEEFAKAEEVCSNTQLYKQAGNSIVVNVLEAILKDVFLIG